jgi:hypothetical protein
MSRITPDIRKELKKYLLRELANDSQRAMEIAILSNSKVFEELLITEEELIDQYVNETS